MFPSIDVCVWMMTYGRFILLSLDLPQTLSPRRRKHGRTPDASQCAYCAV